MEYGLWNLSGSFWAGNTPCTSSDRSLYNSVSAGSATTTAFHGCSGLETMVPFADVTSAQPCRSTLRGQPEFVAMKPATSEAVPILQAGSSSANVEVLPVHAELLTELSGQESCSSNTMTLTTNTQSSNITAMPDTISSILQKKVKQSKNSNRKRSGASKAETSLPAFNQQYNPMYSMMFGRSSLKRPDTSSESEEEEEVEEDNDDNNINDVDTYSNESLSAIGNRLAVNVKVHSTIHKTVFERNGLSEKNVMALSDEVYTYSSSTSSSSPNRSRMGYECGECDLIADTRPALKKHISLCHPGPATLVNNLQKLPSSCPIPSCNVNCQTREILEAHVARHVADGFQRHSTNKKRSNAISLQRVRYEKEEYRCQICSYACTIEKAFYKHLKQHTMGLNITASVKISCVICGKDRPSEVEMNKHMRKHRDGRYFCCDVCVFRTVQLKKLIQHRRMHTGEKPHRCPHCAYRSARRDNLRSHVRRVHKRDNIYCDTFSPRGLLVSQPPSPGDVQ